MVNQFLKNGWVLCDRRFTHYNFLDYFCQIKFIDVSVVIIVIFQKVQAFFSEIEASEVNEAMLYYQLLLILLLFFSLKIFFNINFQEWLKLLCADSFAIWT